MSCVDIMYQFYSPYFPYKSTADDFQKFGGAGMFESQDPVHYLATANNSLSSNTNQKETELDKESQPKGTQYLNPNCVLLTYFSGDISTVVDDHFTRALSEPSSFSSDKPCPTFLKRSDAPLMCHRKLPPSFWNSSYQPTSSNFSLTADAYLTSSWYGFHKNWPYHLTSQAHSYAQQAAHNLSYSSMDSASRFGSHYGSLMMQNPTMAGRMDARHSQYDLAKSTDTFGAGAYYPMPRFGSDVTSNMNLESISGLDLPPKKELYW